MDQCIRDGASECKCKLLSASGCSGGSWLLVSISLLWTQERVVRVQILGNRLALGTEVELGLKELDLMKVVEL
jgi:hypothetical protein